MSSKKDIEKAYEDLRKKGHNTVENLVRWLKDAKILETAMATEEEAALMFVEVDRQAKVSQQEFENVVKNLIKQKDQFAHDLLNMIVTETGKLCVALDAAAQAFTDAMKEQEEENRRYKETEKWKK